MKHTVSRFQSNPLPATLGARRNRKSTGALGVFVACLLGLAGSAMAYSQAVPSQIANVGTGDKGRDGNGGDLQIQYDVDRGANHNSKAYIQFDLSAFPANLSPTGIEKASVVLYVEQGGNAGTFAVCQVGENWSPATINGTNAPGCAGSSTNVTVTPATARFGGFLTIDITPVVQSWFTSGGSNNFGILLAPNPPAPGEQSGVDLSVDALQHDRGYPPILNLVLQSQGPVGPQGATGPLGPVGPQGAMGLIGPVGPQGAVGPQGNVGPVGLTGPVGPQGNVGPAGLTGPIGPQGAVGPAGVTGPVGPQGNVGPAGPAGPTGPQGAAGPTGPPGPAGPTQAPSPSIIYDLTRQQDAFQNTQIPFLEIVTVVQYPYSLVLDGVTSTGALLPAGFGERILGGTCPDSYGNCKQRYRLYWPYSLCSWNGAQYKLTFGYTTPGLSNGSTSLSLADTNWCIADNPPSTEPAPVIASISPTTAVRGQPFTLTISGTDLAPGGNAEIIFNNQAYDSQVSGSNLTYDVPGSATQNAGGVVAITVVTSQEVSNQVLLSLTQ